MQIVSRHVALAVLASAALLAFPARAADMASEIQLRLDNLLQSTEGDARDAALVIRTFYEQRAFAPAWVEDGRAGDKATTMVRILAEAKEHGLEPSDYGTAILAADLQTGASPQLAALDVRLSAALVRYSDDLSGGRVEPRKVDDEIFLDPKSADPLSTLNAAVAAPDLSIFLSRLAPQTPQYARLKEALASYRAMAANGGWTKVPGGETLKPGMSSPRVVALRKRLAETGDAAAGSADSPVYDEALVDSVKAFQFRHGLETDGVVGAGTLAALNTTVEQRIDQMVLNMERRRWMPDDLGQKYVFVNMADFELKVVDEPKTIHVTHVVVGTPFHRTPVFSADMKYIVINPYWHITPTIARNEMLPKIRKDSAYFSKQNIRVFASWSDDAREIDPRTIDWRNVSSRNFPYKLRQDSGDGNALGRIKFMLPNRHNIYLHDTPSKSLFERTVRSFSHGCVRVQYPLDLAEVLLRDEGWTRAKIDAAVESGERQIVNLSHPIPVHITYLTAWANKDGSIHFRDDIYGRDKRLAQALARSRIKS